MPRHRRWRPERASARRPTAGVPAVVGAVAVASTLLLSACAAPVAVPPAAAPPAACAALAAELPKRLAGQDRRTTEPDSTSTAAWGDPPISLRCGVDRPAAYQPTSELVAIDTIDWLPEPLSGGVRFTTIGRSTGVEVTVPNAYAPEASVLAELSPAVSRAIPPE